MTTDETSRWRAALALPGMTDPVESGLAELAMYFGISPVEARRSCASAVADSRREWESGARRTPAEIVGFYRATRSYIFEHVWWHATDGDNGAANVLILDWARARGARRYLDFGAGVGAGAILFARHGFAVTLADVSRSMLDFARWRLERRGLAAEYVDLCEAGLPEARYDLATAVDVLEHLADPARAVARIAVALRPGGALVWNDCTGPDPERPMHIVPSRYPIVRALRRAGLRAVDAGRLGQLGYHAHARGGRGPLADRAWGLYDGVRYGPPGRAARALLLACRGRGARLAGHRGP